MAFERLKKDLSRSVGEYGIRGSLIITRDLIKPRIVASVLLFITSIACYFQYQNDSSQFLSILSQVSYFLIFISFYLFILSIYAIIPKNFYSSFQLICPHCLLTIETSKINDITCPFCKESGKEAHHLLHKCDCGGEIQFYECPHCHKSIDLLEPYDVFALRNKRIKK